MKTTTIRSTDPRMCAIFELIADLGRTNTTVLIEGETGTGKEVVAAAVHEAASHRTGAFVPVNCAAIPETLIESELLGHEKVLSRAPLRNAQVALKSRMAARSFLMKSATCRLPCSPKCCGCCKNAASNVSEDPERIHVDVRVIAASNRGLRQLMECGRFREDLFYRLNVVRIEVPPLRERPNDIPMLATHFLVKYVRPDKSIKQISHAAMEALMGYSWPGNIRELENVLNGSALPFAATSYASRICQRSCWRRTHRSFVSRLTSIVPWNTT